MIPLHDLFRAADREYGPCTHFLNFEDIDHTKSLTYYDQGKDKNLVVVLSIYRPSVSCFRQQYYITNPDYTLQKLLAMIDVSTERQKFGPEGESGVKVVLPLNYAVPSARESIRPQPSPIAIFNRRQNALRILDDPDVK